MNEIEWGLAVMRRVRARIDHLDRWTKGVAARNGDGEPCQPWSEFAAAWCLEGAIQAEMSYPDIVKRWLRCEVEKITSGCTNNHMYFNDGNTHAEVLALLDRVIANVEAGEAGEAGLMPPEWNQVLGVTFTTLYCGVPHAAPEPPPVVEPVRELEDA